MSQVPSVSVYVGDLDGAVDERSLFDHFKEIGPIVSVRVCCDAQTQKSLKYGYVNFQNPPDAESAIDRLNFSKLKDAYIRVNRVERDPSKRRAGRSNIVVKNLPENVGIPELKEFFTKFGRITSLKIATNVDGSHLGYGFVMFESTEASETAIAEMDNMELEGTVIEVIPYSHDYQEKKKRDFTNLYVRGLRADVTQEKLAAIFDECGKTTSIAIYDDKHAESKKGFAFAAFETHEGAAATIAKYHDQIIPDLCDDEPLQVARFKPRKERTRDNDHKRQQRRIENAKFPNLYVKNFDEEITADKLRELFQQCGETISIRVMHDPDTKLSRCFGFVSVKDQTVANRCVTELAGSTVLGPRPLYVARALKRDARAKVLDDRYRRSVQGMHYAPMMATMGNAQGAMFPGMGGGRGGPMGMGGPGVMRGPMNHQMPQQNVMRQQPPMRQQMAPRPQQPAAPPQQQSLATILATVPPEQQQNLLGERLYNVIGAKHPNEAAKITGMLLEMDNGEILNLLESPEQLDAKINEALEVLRRHQSQNAM